MVIKRREPRARRQVDGAPPVVEDSKLPRMGEGDVAPRHVGRATLVMPEEPKPDRGTRNRMAPLRRVKRPVETAPPKHGYADQQPTKPPRRPKGTAKEGYIRLRVLVENGELSIAGAKFVEGPLAATMESVHPGLVYEVTLESRRLAAGGIPDAGVWRSFRDPLGRPGLEGHHIVELPKYEIAVRVPIQELSMSRLSKLKITLYRSTGAVVAAPAEGRSLKAQLKGRVQTIATLDGIRLSRLSKQAQRELRRALA